MYQASQKDEDDHAAGSSTKPQIIPQRMLSSKNSAHSSSTDNGACQVSNSQKQANHSTGQEGETRFTFQPLSEAKFQGFDAKDTQDLLYKWFYLVLF